LKGENARSFRSVSPDEVLDILRADYRLRSGIDPEVDVGAELNRDTTVTEWRVICDLVGTRHLKPFFNQLFGTTLEVAELRAALEPEQSRTLGAVCDIISAKATMPDWQAVSLGGEMNAAAGAFLRLRDLLLSAGAPADIRPSSPVADYARRHIVALGQAVAQLAPGLVPVPTLIWKPSHRWLAPLGLISFVVAIGGLLALSDVVVWIGFTIFAATLIASLITARWAIQQVVFGEYRTFRDLAEAIARYPRPMPNTR
jgi:hypothetical protein